MASKSSIILAILCKTVQFYTAQIHPEEWTIPIVSDEHGILCFGNPFDQNETTQEQSPTDKPQPMDDLPLPAELCQEVDVGLPPLCASQSQAMKTSLTDENVESLSAELYQPVYTFMRRAKVHQNTENPEAYQQEIPSTLSQESVATGTDVESIDADLGTLLACGDLGSLALDDVNIEPLIDMAIEMPFKKDTSQVRNALMTCARFNTSEPSALLQVSAASFDSTNKKIQNVDERRDVVLTCPGLSGSACRQAVGSARSNPSQSLPQSTFFNNHVSNQNGQKPVKCAMYQEQFRTANSCQMHEQKHTGEKPFQCDICAKQLCSFNEYQTHRPTHRGEKPFKCDFCRKEFSDRRVYETHRRIHTGEKPFRCDFCKKEFNDRSSWHKHRRTHTGEKPFQCEFCKKEFSERSSCQRHRRIHTGEKPFQCDICPKQFLNSGNYQTHRRTHTGEKPFLCNACPKQFSTSSDHRRHLRTHTGEKPFQCDICSKQFGTSSSCRRHRRTHTGVR